MYKVPPEIIKKLALFHILDYIFYQKQVNNGTFYLNIPCFYNSFNYFTIQLQLMEEFLPGFGIWHFWFTLTFVLRGHRSPQIDDITLSGIKIPFCCFWGLKTRFWGVFQFWASSQFWTSSQLLNLYFFGFQFCQVYLTRWYDKPYFRQKGR